MYRLVAWAGIAVLVAGAVFEAAERDWAGVLLFAGFAAGTVVVVGCLRWLPSLFRCLGALAANLSAFGWTWDVARRFALYDQLNHVFTIFAITLTLGYVAYHPVRVRSGSTARISRCRSRASACPSARSGRSSSG